MSYNEYDDAEEYTEEETAVTNQYDGGDPIDDADIVDDDIADESARRDYESESEAGDLQDAEEIEKEIEREKYNEIARQVASKYKHREIIIKPENRITTDTLTKFNMTEIVSIRAAQIAKFNNCLVNTDGLTSAVAMAKRELMMRKCPLKLRRVVGTVCDHAKKEVITYIEVWSPNDMKFAIHWS